jgi:hypothetical protein
VGDRSEMALIERGYRSCGPLIGEHHDRRIGSGFTPANAREAAPHGRRRRAVVGVLVQLDPLQVMSATYHYFAYFSRSARLGGDISPQSVSGEW